MIDPDIKRFIQQEIRMHLNLITSGKAGTNTVHKEDIQERFPGMPTMAERPIMHPYGIASRAPQGTLQVTAQMGDHPGNVSVLGHRDKDRPDDLQSGESVLYSLGKFRVYARGDRLEIGKDGDNEVLPVGDTLLEFLVELLQLIVQHTHLGNLGYPTGVPQNAADFTQLQTENLDNEKILAKDGGRF